MVFTLTPVLLLLKTLAPSSGAETEILFYNGAKLLLNLENIKRSLLQTLIGMVEA